MDRGQCPLPTQPGRHVWREKSDKQQFPYLVWKPVSNVMKWPISRPSTAPCRRCRILSSIWMTPVALAEPPSQLRTMFCVASIRSHRRRKLEMSPVNVKYSLFSASMRRFSMCSVLDEVPARRSSRKVSGTQPRQISLPRTPWSSQDQC